MDEDNMQPMNVQRLVSLVFLAVGIGFGCASSRLRSVDVEVFRILLASPEIGVNAESATIARFGPPCEVQELPDGARLDLWIYDQGYGLLSFVAVIYSRHGHPLAVARSIHGGLVTD